MNRLRTYRDRALCVLVAFVLERTPWRGLCVRVVDGRVYVSSEAPMVPEPPAALPSVSDPASRFALRYDARGLPRGVAEVPDA